MYISHFVTQNVKKMYEQRSGLNIINHFYCSTKDLLKQYWLFFFFFNCQSMTEVMTWFGVLTGFAARADGFIHYCFCIFSANKNTVKNENNISILLWKWLWPWGWPRVCRPEDHCPRATVSKYSKTEFFQHTVKGKKIKGTMY